MTDLEKLSLSLTFYSTHSSTFLLSSPGNQQNILLFWAWIFEVLHINGIIQYISFQNSHILLITHLSRCIHFTMTAFSFIHKLESIPFYVWIYLSMDTYRFHLFVMNTAIMKMGMQYLFENNNFSTHEHIISRTAELYDISYFHFWETCRSFCKIVILVFIYCYSIQGSSSFFSLWSTFFLYFLGAKLISMRL